MSEILTEETRPISPALDHAIRQHLEEILNSEVFRTSRRSSEFFRHIIERALANDIDSLKERLLGIDIFHRPNDYDTSSDSIVRVTANDVRRRLAKFYSEHGTEERPVTFTLPLGTYVPEFTQTGHPLAVFEPPQPVQHEDATKKKISKPAVLISSDRKEIHVDSTDLKIVEHGSGHGPWSWRWTIAVAAMVLLAGTAGWYLHASLDSPRIPRELHIYKELLGSIGADSPNETEVALSNPRLLLYRGSSTPQPEHEDELQILSVPESMTSALNQTANDNQADFPFHSLRVDGTNYTGVGEAHAAFALSGLMQALGRHVRLTEARFLNWDAARQQQLILLGAPHMSAFAQGTLSTAHFAMEHDAILNNHPSAGEQALYPRVVHNDQLLDYGLIWMAKSPSGARVLVLAGLTSSGTEGVGSFFSNPEKMRAVYDQLSAQRKNGAFPEVWQALLRIDARQNVPVNTTLIAVHSND